LFKPLLRSAGLGIKGRLVTPTVFFSLVPALVGLFASGPNQSVTRLVNDEETILRVPVLPRPEPPKIEWVEHKGPECIPVHAIRRAKLVGSDRVDFVLANRPRVRAEFNESCPALDFYGGFYLRTEDRKLCAGRDVIHSRMGGSCTIERFKELVPKEKG
jgi:hypothetical protein